MQYFNRAASSPLLEWLSEPLIEGRQWPRRLRHYATFMLLIALSSPLSHAYLGIELTVGQTIIHTAVVVAAVAIAIVLIEAAIACLRAIIHGRSGPVRPMTTGAFLARAAAAYALSSVMVGPMHSITPYTAKIMIRHSSAAQTAMAWDLLPVAMLIVYVAYQGLRKNYLARQVAALRRLNEELEAARENGGLPEIGELGEHSARAALPSSAILVSANGVEVPLPPESIVRIQAEENYCLIVPDTVAAGTAKSHLVRMTLREALERVPGALFVQTHRSHIVNLRHVAELRREGRKRELRLGNGDRVPVSRARLGTVESRLRDRLSAVVGERAHRGGA
jgi:DNA-binding LytR/AlgR family response regulator